jgi:hypothetical protein
MGLQLLIMIMDQIKNLKELESLMKGNFIKLHLHAFTQDKDSKFQT